MLVELNTTKETLLNSPSQNNIDVSAGEGQELAKLIKRLDKPSTVYGIAIGAERTKLATNNPSGIKTEIKASRWKHETVTSFKYLGSFITDEGFQQQQHGQG